MRSPYFDFAITQGGQRMQVRGDEYQLRLMARAFEVAAETGEFHVADGTLVIVRVGHADVHGSRCTDD